MSYLCQKCKKELGITVFVSEIKRVENYSDFGVRISAWSTGVYSKNIEGVSTEANNLSLIS